MDGFQMDQTVITQLGLLPMGILKRVNGGAGPWLSKSVLGDFQGFLVQWGLEFRTLKTERHPKSELFKVPISKGQMFRFFAVSLDLFINNIFSLRIKRSRLTTKKSEQGCDNFVRFRTKKWRLA